MKYLKMANRKENEITPKKLKLDSCFNDSVGNELNDSSLTPTKSRFGRSHKPKMLGDFLSTDKKVSAVLKVNPGNQMKFFLESGKIRSPKKERSPKKSSGNPPAKIVKKLQLTPAVIPPADIKIEANELDPVPGCEWMVGDLAWARVGNHPFWPCIVNIDPTCKIFTRIRMFSRSSVPLRWLHVQFFGDNGRRSWLFSSAVMNYTGREAFENLAKSILSGMKRKDPRQVSALIVKPHLRSVWESAVNEAESLLGATREERVLYFRKLYPIQLIPVNRALSEDENGRLGDGSVRVPKKRGRKRKAESMPGDTVVASKLIKLERYSPEPEKEMESPKSRTLSPKKLSILERVRLSQKSDDSEEPRSPSLRLKKKKEEEEERKRVEEVQKKIEARRRKEEAKSAEKESTKKEDSAIESRRTRGESASTLQAELKKDKLKKNKKKNGRFGADFRVFMNKHFDRVLDEHSDMKEKDVEKYLEKMWLDMDEHQKLRYRPRININSAGNKSSDEDTYNSECTDNEDDRTSVERTSNSSEKSSSPVPLAMATSRSGIGKRSWSLFNGALPGKVCQICEKPGDTLRCKGPCSGTYHLECALNPLEMSARRQELKIEFKPKSNRKKKDKRGRKKSFISSEGSKNDSVINDKSITAEDVDGDISDDKTDEKCNESFDKEKELSSNEKVDKESSPQVNCVVGSKNVDDNDSNLKINKKEEIEAPSEESIEEKENGLDKSKNKKSRGKGSKESNDSGEEVEGLGEFRCPDCSVNRVQPCFFCGLEEKNGDKIRIRCHIAHCGKVYHAECLKAWPQTSWTSGGKRGGLVKADVMTCPQHSCHTCVSDNPGAIKARFQNDKLVRCLRCPTSYHYGNHCLPAGSEVITSRQIICPKHYRPQKKGTHHVNAAWCFICATGGSLICCDLCPTAFHADCLKISTPEGGYVCEDCETGRFPLYGEVVWVKLGSYRWWPAQILFPHQIPDNIHNLPHSRGEFAVRFFGSHDHYWVNRGRVFLYQEGDSGKGSGKQSAVDQVFFRAVQEASDAYLKLKNEKSIREAESRPGMKPPNYIKIKTNKPVGAVRMMEANISSMTPCECDPKSRNPCAPDSDCLNRILMVECNPLICPAGERCNNQMFEKREYPPLMPYRTEGRGWGLKTLTDLKKGQFVIEYVGEMIDEEEYQKRLKKMHESNDENYYFLTIDKDRMLDAGPKGNVARFMNHSCQPNCETQKWTVNGDTRVGLFSLCDIQADTELVFNYNLESIGTDKKPCMCGAPNCSGFIGVKVTKNNNGDDDKKGMQMKKGVNKKIKFNKSSSSSDDVCFMCGEGGELLLCDTKACPKGYHISCLKRTKWPQGKWLCPWHQCNICNKGKVKRCTFCVNSYCPNHVEGNIRLDDNLGLVCTKHDNKAEQEEILNDEKKPDAEQLGVEVDSLMEVDEALTSEDPNDIVSDLILPEGSVPISSSSPVPQSVPESSDSDNKIVSNIKEDVVEENKCEEIVSKPVDELKELVVTKPTREYRNKRLRSGSDIVNGVSKSITSSRRQRPVSVDSPVGVAASSIKCEKDNNISKVSSSRKQETVGGLSKAVSVENLKEEEKSDVKKLKNRLCNSENPELKEKCTTGEKLIEKIPESEAVVSKEVCVNAENGENNEVEQPDENMSMSAFGNSNLEQHEVNNHLEQPTNNDVMQSKEINESFSLTNLKENLPINMESCLIEVSEPDVSVNPDSSSIQEKDSEDVKQVDGLSTTGKEIPVVMNENNEKSCFFTDNNTNLGKDSNKVTENLPVSNKCVDSLEENSTLANEKELLGKDNGENESSNCSSKVIADSAKIESKINEEVDVSEPLNFISVLPYKETFQPHEIIGSESIEHMAVNVVNIDEKVPHVESVNIDPVSEQVIHNTVEIESQDISEMQGSVCSKTEKSNCSVESPNLDDSAVCCNTLSTEQNKIELCDSSNMKDVVSSDLDKDVLMNGACTVSV